MCESPFKVNSHKACAARAVPVPCRVAKGLDCLSHLIYTVRPCLIHTYHTMPFPCRAPAVLKATSQGHGTAEQGGWHRHSTAWHVWINIAVGRRPVDDLSRFGSFRLPRGVPRRLSSESQTEMQLAGVKSSNVFVMDKKKSIILVPEHECWIIYSTKTTITI